VTLTAPDSARIGGTVVANLPVAELYEHAIRAAEGTIAAEGSLVVRTGQHTGREYTAYDAAPRKIAGMFHDNFARYADGVSEAVRNAGPAVMDPDNSVEG
jgi:ATP-dependent phosphoenolpyruvate carboxykinase